MPKTIKTVLEALNKGEYVGKGGVDTALAEIRQLLKECEPKTIDGRYSGPYMATYCKGIDEYTANIEKRLG